MQHRESQGNESDLFMSYFPHGLKYQEGGVESAFHKTSPGTAPAAIKKLYQVKGKKNIRATERVLSWDSFNTGDCFILDLGQNIFAWCGAKSNILERNKARTWHWPSGTASGRARPTWRSSPMGRSLPT